MHEEVREAHGLRQRASAVAAPRRFTPAQFGTLIGLFVVVGLLLRILTTLGANTFPAQVWGFQLVNGLILGGVYALIALGYTLVYGILLMINFAHGEILMLGAYAGYFSLFFMNRSGLLAANPILAVVLALAVGMGTSMAAGIALERIAYRPLRGAPRLVPLISAIGASIFLQNFALLAFGPSLKVYPRLPILQGSVLEVEGVSVSRVAVLILATSIVLMLGLVAIVRLTRFGRAMRAVAEDRQTAALMGINPDRIVSQTFALGSLLAGAAGVMLGFYNNQVNHVVGFIPGLKAFTAAVLGGIGNVPGAMLGGIFLGLAEALGPTALDIPSEYKDVIAFGLLVLVLVLRPTGLLGEVLASRRA